MKIRPVGSKSFMQTNEGADGKTDEAYSHFSQFANSPKKEDVARFAVAPPFWGRRGVVPCTDCLGVKMVRLTQ